MIQLKNSILVTVGILMIFSFALLENVPELKKLGVSFSATPSSSAYINSLPNEEKATWMQSMPDSVTLDLSFSVQIPDDFHGKINVYVGSFSDAFDIFKGTYDLESKSSPQGIQMSTKNEKYFFRLGELSKLKEFYLTVWLETDGGVAGPVLKYTNKQ